MSLPTELPKWYTVPEHEDKGWTPQTSDIIQAPSQPQNKVIREAWYAKNNPTYTPEPAKKPTLQLQILTPIQVGGGSLPEGMILPAQIGGYPCIPGSSLKGALLSWVKSIWSEIKPPEQDFWKTLIQDDRSGWRPRAIRFESIPLKNLEPYPLNAQQSWQVFLEPNKALSIQWQACPQDPPSTNPEKIGLQVIPGHPLQSQEKMWLNDRLRQALEQQGVGRGKNSGFGRLAETIPNEFWKLELTGMKPGIQTRDSKKNQEGKYRWSPQVLRANLRSWFLRLALSQLSKTDAEKLTDRIFGGFGSPAQLKLVSYRVYTGKVVQTKTQSQGKQGGNSYANVPRSIVDETWTIRVKCNEDFKPLVGQLLELAQRLGGLGPGWRRPPHVLTRFNGFRGSELTTTTDYNDRSLTDLFQTLTESIQYRANQHRLTLRPPQNLPTGAIHGIWKSENPDQWEDIVHGVCATNANKRPPWCGSTNRPSSYAVREHSDHCLITTFEAGVGQTLQQHGFTKIWPQ